MRRGRGTRACSASSVTDAGRTIAAQVADARRALMRGVLDALDPDERTTITDALGRLSAVARAAVAHVASTDDARNRERAG